MKSIAIELGYRGFYLLLAYLGIEICFYFCFGMMCEYVIAFYQCHYQSIDFGFYNNYQHHSNPYIHGKSGKSSFFDSAELSYQSKSWGLLDLSCARYVHENSATYTLLLWYYKAMPLFLIFAFQCGAFIVPGVQKRIRNTSFFVGVIMILLSHTLLVIAIPLFVAMNGELQIEPFDSEALSIS